VRLQDAFCMSCDQPIKELRDDVGLSRCQMPCRYFALICHLCGGQARARLRVARHASGEHRGGSARDFLDCDASSLPSALSLGCAHFNPLDLVMI
jgi:hypothetical protein